MKTFFSEYKVDYSTYTFGYTAYCILEPQDKMSEIYEKGFLPFTGKLDIKDDIFYMARSLRIDLNSFSDSSENRRINRKIEALKISFKVIPKEEFDLQNPVFRKLCLDYADGRYSMGGMSEERFEYVLSKSTASHIFEFKSEGKTIGYIISYIDNEILQYWFSFFDVELMSYSLGKWMMWSAIDWAKTNNLKYVYLGTVYNPKSLYKVRDFKGVEFYDGSCWNTDIKILKHWCKTDEEERNIDRFKEG